MPAFTYAWLFQPYELPDTIYVEYVQEKAIRELGYSVMEYVQECGKSCIVRYEKLNMYPSLEPIGVIQQWIVDVEEV